MGHICLKRIIIIKKKKKLTNHCFSRHLKDYDLPDFLGAAVHVQAIQPQESLNLDRLSLSH